MASNASSAEEMEYSSSSSCSDSDDFINFCIENSKTSFFSKNSIGHIFQRVSSNMNAVQDINISQSTMMQRAEKIDEEAENDIEAFEHIGDVCTISDKTFQKRFRVSRPTFKDILDVLKKNYPEFPMESMSRLTSFLWYLGSEDEDVMKKGCTIFKYPNENAFEDDLELTAKLLTNFFKAKSLFEIVSSVYERERSLIALSSTDKPTYWGVLNKRYFPAQNGGGNFMHVISDNERFLFRYAKESEISGVLPNDLIFFINHAAKKLLPSEYQSKKILCADLSYDINETLRNSPHTLSPEQLLEVAQTYDDSQKTELLKDHNAARIRSSEIFAAALRRFPRLKLLWKFSPHIIQCALMLHNYCTLTIDTADY